MKCYPSLPTTIVLFNIVVTGVAHTEAVDRFVVSRVPTFDGIYVATLRLGYRDPIDLEGVAAGVREAIVGLERRSGEGGDERIRRVEVSIRTVTHMYVPPPRFPSTSTDIAETESLTSTFLLKHPALDSFIVRPPS
jgi:KUP system potassium uptake protein